MDFFITNFFLVLLILLSGVLLFFPKLLLGDSKAISTKEAVLLMNRQPTSIIDVRSKDEFMTTHLPNAISLPLNELKGRLGGLKKNKTILVYCQSGVTSAKAVKILSQHSFDSIISLEGGFEAWVKDNLPITSLRK